MHLLDELDVVMHGAEEVGKVVKMEAKFPKLLDTLADGLLDLGLLRQGSGTSAVKLEKKVLYEKHKECYKKNMSLTIVISEARRF